MPKPFTLAEVIALERSVRRRNLAEWAAAAVVGLVFGVIAMATTGLVRVASATEIAAAAAYVAFRLYRDGRTQFVDRERDGADAARLALIRELRRQAALLSRVPVWYVAPLAAGWCGLEAADVIEHGLTLQSAIYVAVCLLFAAIVVGANRGAAHRMSARAVELETVALVSVARS